LLVMYVTLHDEGTARNISGKNNKKGWRPEKECKGGNRKLLSLCS
jgi:hypothetical protein